MFVLKVILWNDFQSFYWKKNYNKEPTYIKYREKTFVKNSFFKFLSFDKILLSKFYFSLIYYFKNISDKNRSCHKLIWHKNYERQGKKIRRKRIGLRLEKCFIFKQTELDNLKKDKMHTVFTQFLSTLNLKFLEIDENQFYLKGNDILVEKAATKKSIFLKILIQNFFTLKQLAKNNKMNKKLSKNLKTKKKKNFEKETEFNLGSVLRRCTHFVWNKNCDNFLVSEINQTRNTRKKVEYFNRFLKSNRFLDLETIATTSLIKIKNVTSYQKNLIKKRKNLNLDVFLLCNFKRRFVNEYGNKIFL